MPLTDYLWGNFIVFLLYNFMINELTTNDPKHNKLSIWEPVLFFHIILLGFYILNNLREY